jgi:tetratricopeptide (TPR) repeat protein
VALAVVFSAAAPHARAADDGDRAAALAHYRRGMTHYQLSEYREALSAFKEAFRVKNDPAFLYNIAQCHRKLGHAQDAITFYRTYLRRAPRAANRAEVERQITELERAPAPAPPPPPASGPPPPAPAVASPAPDLAAKSGGPDAPADQPLILVQSNAAPAPAAETPFYKRGWFWIVTGAVVVGAAATVIVLSTRSESGPFCPDCAGTTVIAP